MAPPVGRRAAARPDGQAPTLDAVEAAFFDLDKTVIAKASIMAFARDFRREGLLTRRTMARGLWLQLVYVHLGARVQEADPRTSSVLSVTRGWDQSHVRRWWARSCRPPSIRSPSQKPNS